MLKSEIDTNKLPKHIAYIIDGNGRWAKKRGLARSFGHKAGMQALKNAITYGFQLGVKIISVYGFSTENWKRPKDEIDYLFQLFREFIANDFNELLNQEIKLNIMGDYSKLPSDLVKEIEKALLNTQHKTKYILNLGINYGGREEIVRAVNLLLKSNVKNITASEFEKYLYTAELPDPDFIIRTSGEKRISNFMLWQSAYSELYFPTIYWPDFNKRALIKSIIEYQKRNRRFGAL